MYYVHYMCFVYYFVLFCILVFALIGSFDPPTGTVAHLIPFHPYVVPCMLLLSLFVPLGCQSCSASLQLLHRCQFACFLLFLYMYYDIYAHVHAVTSHVQPMVPMCCLRVGLEWTASSQLPHICCFAQLCWCFACIVAFGPPLASVFAVHSPPELAVYVVSLPTLLHHLASLQLHLRCCFLVCVYVFVAFSARAHMSYLL